MTGHHSYRTNTENKACTLQPQLQAKQNTCRPHLWQQAKQWACMRQLQQQAKYESCTPQSWQQPQHKTCTSQPQKQAKRKTWMAQVQQQGSTPHSGSKLCTEPECHSHSIKIRINHVFQNMWPSTKPTLRGKPACQSSWPSMEPACHIHIAGQVGSLCTTGTAGTQVAGWDWLTGQARSRKSTGQVKKPDHHSQSILQIKKPECQSNRLNRSAFHSHTAGQEQSLNTISVASSRAQSLHFTDTIADEEWSLNITAGLEQSLPFKVTVASQD